MTVNKLIRLSEIPDVSKYHYRTFFDFMYVDDIRFVVDITHSDQIFVDLQMKSYSIIVNSKSNMILNIEKFTLENKT